MLRIIGRSLTSVKAVNQAAPAVAQSARAYSKKASFAEVYDNAQTRKNDAFKNSAEFKQLEGLYNALAQSGALSDQLKAGNWGAPELEAAKSSNPNLKADFDALANAINSQNASAARSGKPPVRVAITGGAGNIGYAMAFRIASGEMLGPDQPVILQLLDLKNVQPALQGVIMELNDCAFPLLHGIIGTDDPRVAFADADYAMLVGAKPRSKGMERGDLLMGNANIFKEQGAALSDVARASCRTVVVGNPANTNALIAASNCKNISSYQFSAMTRLDHNRALAQIAGKTGCATTDISRFAIWGNHSPTMYPDVSHTLINGKWAKDVINDAKWIEKTFIPAVQQRGAAIIEARGASSAASAASSAIDHIRDWVKGSDGWQSMAVLSDGGSDAYGIDDGLYSSYPVVCAAGTYTRVGNIPIDEFSAAKIDASRKELVAERDAVKSLIGKHL